MSRLETILGSNPESPLLVLPPVLGFDHLISDLHEVGFQSSSGFSSGPLTFMEIDSWSRVTQTLLTAWEARTLRRLSEVFVNQVSISDDPACPAPSLNTGEEVDISEGAQKSVTSFFKGLAASRKSSLGTSS